MEDNLIMSKKELNRKAILERVLCNKLQLKDAAIFMEVSYRQAGRIKKRYIQDGDVGLIHKSRGKIPCNAYSKEYKTRIINLYKEKYLEFGPTLATEKLEEDDKLIINTETLRLWLKKEGLWHRKRKYKFYKERRIRKPRFGDLLQIDGSIHYWFPSREHQDCLLNIVDDATGVTMAELATGETTEVLLRVLKKWIKTYGVPKAVYVDLKSVYVGSRQWTHQYEDERYEGFSVFQKVCRRLGIEIIKAYSPEAKGRVERKHGVFQDRLVKDIRLYNLTTIAEANQHLETRFLNQINNKFSKPPRDKTNAHRDAKAFGNLDEIICWDYTRKLRNDWTIRLKNEFYQVDRKHSKSCKPDAEIVIKKYLDGKISLFYNEAKLNYHKLDYKPEAPSKSKRYYKVKGKEDPIKQSIRAKNNKHKSPWSTFNPSWLKSA